MTDKFSCMRRYFSVKLGFLAVGAARLKANSIIEIIWTLFGYLDLFNDVLLSFT